MIGSYGDKNMTPKIRAVIFDMDGVLTDSEPLINAAAIAMFREKGLGCPAGRFPPLRWGGRESLYWWRG